MLTGPALKAGLDFPGLIEAMRQGHQAPLPAMERTLMVQPMGAGEEDKAVLTWHAWAHEDLLALKTGTLFPGNTRLQPPVPAVQCLTLLFDGRDGRPLAVIDATELTYWKTAADTALGSHYLAAHEAESLLVIGAGGLAPYHIQAFRTVRPGLRRIQVWNRTPDKALALTRDPFLAGVTVEVAPDLQAAVAQADIVCCLTSATAPLLHGDWLGRGAHVALVGSYTPAMREADDQVFRRGSVFVDTRQFTIGQCGDLIGPMAAGILTAQDVRADLGELCRGEHPGRVRADEITIYKNAGGAHLDMYAARYALACLGAGGPA